MCLIFISLHQHPQYKLIVAANRDEFYARETATAHSWEDYPQIYGGRDLEAGGTWMAMNKVNGRLSMVTNYRDPTYIRKDVFSRGHLVSDYLIDSNSPELYMQKIKERAQHYNGFNLITGTPNELFYFSNYQNQIQKLTPGIHGLSNHLLNTPWPKVKRGLMKVNVLMQEINVSMDKMLDLLYDDMTAQESELPDTGIGLEREKILSSMFIKSPGYGTRCSTVIFVDNSDNVQFGERVYDTTTFDFETKKIEFSLAR